MEIAEARSIAEKLMEHYDSLSCEYWNTGYYTGILDALNWISKGGIYPLFSKEELANIKEDNNA